MIIRILKFFVTCLLSLNVKYGLRWILKISLKSNKNEQGEEKDLSLPLKRDLTRLCHMNKIITLCETNIQSDHVVVMKSQRLKIPRSGWISICAAAMVVMAVISVTSRNFCSSDSYSWYCLWVVATTCIVQQVNTAANPQIFLQEIQILLYRLLPFRRISRLWGWLCSVYIKPSLRPYFYKLFIKVYRVNLKEALVTELTHYQTMGDFFCRRIQPELRPICSNAEIVSPVDGTIIFNDVLYNGTVQQVKGINYSISKFLGPHGNDRNASVESFTRSLMSNPSENQLYCSVIYLAAGDYHRFHSPADWSMHHRRHFVGDLMSVNPKFLPWIPDLFVLNERVVLSGTWKHGFFSMAPVGAINVGSIVVHNDETLATNLPGSIKDIFFDRSFKRGVQYEKGEEVGMFKLGSTVVLIFEAPCDSKFCHQAGKKINFGEEIFMHAL